MKSYDGELKIKDALQIYFSNYHFKNGGYQDKYFRIKLGSFYIRFPNTKARLAAVKIHDIHHIITEYEATFVGEAEIAGWEIASGCNKYYMAWVLNTGSFFCGIFLCPKLILKSFLKGRLCKTNLYHGSVYNEELLNKKVGDMRDFISSPQNKTNSFIDYVLFIFYSLFTLFLSLVFFASIVLTVQKLISG